MNKRANRATTELLKIASNEKAILLSGDLEGLSRLEAKKAALLADIAEERDQIDPKLLSKLRRALHANHLLFGAALQAIQAVKDQLSTLTAQNGAGFSTYSEDGALSPTSRANSRFEKRA